MGLRAEIRAQVLCGCTFLRDGLEEMNPESRQTIHIGVNFVFSPVLTIDPQSKLGFQQQLLQCGIEFARVDFKDRELTVIRETPTRLEIRVGIVGGAPISQLLILSPDPKAELHLFVKEAEAVIEAFESTWPSQNRQIVSSDVTFRDLYESTAEHAFRELWEKRLGQPQSSLAMLGRPVLGGGLRLVMPPKIDEPEPEGIEIKIESFLQDTKKLFVETQVTWPTPGQPGAPFDAERRLEDVDRFIEDKVEPFVAGGS